MREIKFKQMGFVTEILPSGKINIVHPSPFEYNGLKTVICNRGKYTITTEHKSIQSLLETVESLSLL